VQKNISGNRTSKFIEKKQLIRLKIKSMRAGVWFRVLSRIDRVLVDLTIRLVQNIRSPLLANRILSVVEKLECLMESKFARTIRQVGFQLTCKISLLAQKWGNKVAKDWAEDEKFATYLTVIRFNV